LTHAIATFGFLFAGLLYPHGESRAEPRNPSLAVARREPLARYFPPGASAYLEIHDAGGTAERLLESGPIRAFLSHRSVAAFHSSPEGLQLRLALAFFEGITGVPSGQLPGALRQSRIGIATYGTERTRPRVAFVIDGSAPALRRLLSGLERLSLRADAPQNATPAPGTPLPSAALWRAAGPGDVPWIWSTDPDLVQTPTRPENSLATELGLGPLQRAYPHPALGWLWISAAGLSSLQPELKRLGSIFPLPGPAGWSADGDEAAGSWLGIALDAQVSGESVTGASTPGAALDPAPREATRLRLSLHALLPDDVGRSLPPLRLETSANVLRTALREAGVRPLDSQADPAGPGQEWMLALADLLDGVGLQHRFQPQHELELHVELAARSDHAADDTDGGSGSHTAAAANAPTTSAERRRP